MSSSTTSGQQQAATSVTSTTDRISDPRYQWFEKTTSSYFRCRASDIQRALDRDEVRRDLLQFFDTALFSNMFVLHDSTISPPTVTVTLGTAPMKDVITTASSKNNQQQQQQNQQQNNQQHTQQNNNTSTSNQMGQQQSSVFGTAGPTSSSVFNNNNAGGEQSSNNGGSRLNVPSLNTLSCLTSTQAVAISRNSLLLVSASNGNLRGARFNTQNLMTLPFVINDVCVLKANSAFTGERVSKMLAGSSDAVQNYAPTGMTVVFVAADRNLSLVYVPL